MLLQIIMSQSYLENRVVFSDQAENALSVSDTSINQITFLQVYKSSDWSDIFTFDKDYFCIYSTDHVGNNDAKIMWGQMDNPNFLNFQEVAEIIVSNDGYQQESPYLFRVPTSVSGLQEEAFLSFHTSTSDPDNNGKQQSHLNISEGGNYLHLSTWVEKNQTNGDNMFGLETGDNHTGYSRQILKPDNTLIAYHSRLANVDYNLNKSIFSQSSNGYDWVRVPNSEIGEGESLLNPNSIVYSRLDIIPFYYNSTLYACLKASKYFSIVTLNPTTYRPETLITHLFDRTINNVSSYYQHTIYIENGVLYLYFRDIFDGQGTLTGDWFLTKYYLDEII